MVYLETGGSLAGVVGDEGMVMMETTERRRIYMETPRFELELDGPSDVAADDDSVGAHRVFHRQDQEAKSSGFPGFPRSAGGRGEKRRPEKLLVTV